MAKNWSEGAREVRSPRGTEISAKSWQTEAPLRMLQNNLHPDVAERPEELVVYGGIGRAARDWRSYDRIVAALLGLLAVKPLPPVAPPPADHPRWLTLMPAMPRVSATTRRIFTLAAATGFLSFAVFGYFLAIAPGRYADLLDYARLPRVISYATIVAVINVVLLTALSTLGAMLYNVVASLVGGVKVSLMDE